MQRLDTLVMSLQAIRSNKLRSGLTLFGVILGVASIIAVMTAISVVQGTMEKEMTILGAQTFQVQKWLSGPTTEEERRLARNWPPVTIEEADAIREQVDSVDIVGPELWNFQLKAEYRGEMIENAIVVGGTPEYAPNNTHFVAYGRNVSRMDVRSARKVAVIGSAIAERLYPFVDPIGREIRVDGRNYEIIGVFDEKKSAFNSGYDSYVLIPITTFIDTWGMLQPNGFPRSVNVTIHAKTPELIDDAMEETRAVLRRMRGLPRSAPDNFEMFNSESSISQFNEMTAGVKLGAFVIGAIALVVAGIGIMNIMLVSVTERTKEIGVRKSLGAKPRDILRQFLLEAIVLCNVGGVIGVLIGFGFGNLLVKLGMSPSFESVVPLQWAVVGLLFCTSVGLLFGMLPAIKASRLNPIDALRYE
ncbi:MAG: ABC transporter permease [Woeseiaceae bacterium]|nr:ABC transporter permease [Woeseiaceae bacterium]